MAFVSSDTSPAILRMQNANEAPNKKSNNLRKKARKRKDFIGWIQAREQLVSLYRHLQTRLTCSQIFRAAPFLKPGAARNNAYLPVVELPLLSEVVFDLDLSLDFLLDLSDDPDELDTPDELVLPEFASGAVELPGAVDAPPGVLVPGVVVEPGVLVELGGGADVPAPPACANRSEPPRKTPTAGVSSNANFLFMFGLLSGR